MSKVGMEGLHSCPRRVGHALQWFGRQVRQYVTVEPVMLFYMLGSFLQYSAVIQLLYLKLCVIEFNNTSACQNLSSHPDMEKYTQDAASNWLIILNAFLMVASIASTLFYGAWSDRVGRRVTIILPAVGSVLNGIILIFCAKFMLLSPWYVVAGTLVMGLFGSFPTLTTAVFSYMGDVTTSETQTLRFSILEAMTFTGSFIGLITCGTVIDNAGYIAVFAYFIACNVVVVLYTVFWLRESVPSVSTSNTAPDSDDKVLVDDIDSQVETDLGTPDATPKGCCRELVRFENLKSAGRVLLKKRPHYGRLQIFLLISCLFTLQLAGEGFTDTIILYLKKAPLEFDSTTIGFFQGFKNGLTALMLIVGMPLLRLTKLHDTVIALIALIFRSGAFVMIAFARQRLTVFLMPILYCPSGIPAAVTRSLLSKNVGLTEQGGLFSLTGAVETLTTFLSSAIFNALYPATKSIIGGGFVFIVMAILLIIPMLLMMWVRSLQQGNTAYRPPGPPTREERFGHLELHCSTIDSSSL